LKGHLHRFFTRFPKKLLKIGSVRAPLLLFLTLFCLPALPACSFWKAHVLPKETRPAQDYGLIGKGEDEVKKKLGEPSDISKTSEGRLLWVYRPSWKLMPNDNGTRYVEFQDGKVTKVFKKQ